MQSGGNSKCDLQPAAATGPENLSEIHYFRPHPRPTELERGIQQCVF